MAEPHLEWRASERVRKVRIVVISFAPYLCCQPTPSFPAHRSRTSEFAVKNGMPLRSATARMRQSSVRRMSSEYSLSKIPSNSRLTGNVTWSARLNSGRRTRVPVAHGAWPYRLRFRGRNRFRVGACTLCPLLPIATNASDPKRSNQSSTRRSVVEACRLIEQPGIPSR